MKRKIKAKYETEISEYNEIVSTSNNSNYDIDVESSLQSPQDEALYQFRLDLIKNKRNNDKFLLEKFIYSLKMQYFRLTEEILKNIDFDTFNYTDSIISKIFKIQIQDVIVQIINTCSMDQLCYLDQYLSYTDNIETLMLTSNTSRKLFSSDLPRSKEKLFHQDKKEKDIDLSDPISLFCLHEVIEVRIHQLKLWAAESLLELKYPQEDESSTSELPDNNDYASDIDIIGFEYNQFIDMD